MPALYRFTFVGGRGDDVALLFIGGGAITGVDAAGGRYQGRYIERDGRLCGTVRYTMAVAQGLEIGAMPPAGSSYNLQLDFPPDFANGKVQQMLDPGHLPVHVTVAKLKDMPALAQAA
jgi:hypothetical protein